MVSDVESAKSDKEFQFLPLTISIETLGGIATPLVLRGTPLPASRSKVFSTASDNQKSVEFKLLMGESPIAKKNIVLTSALLKDIPQAPKGEPQIQVMFEIDRKCNIKVHALEKRLKSELRVESGEASTHLSLEQIEKMLRQAEQGKAEDQALLKYIEAKNSAQSVIHKAEEYLKNQQKSGLQSKYNEEIEKAVASLGLALEMDKAEDIRTRVSHLESLLGQVPQYDFGGFGDIFDAFFSSPKSVSKQSSVGQTKDVYAHQGRVSKQPVRRERASEHNLATVQGRNTALGKIFGGGEFTSDPNLCFVLMPLAQHMSAIYHDHIRSVVMSEGLSPLRADEIHGPNAITWDVWEKINRARIIIADLTGRNPNVFYEVGLAHAISKDVILLTQSMDDVPFDLKALRCIVYSFTPRGMQDMEKKLRATIKTLVRSS
jgi:hypothetical protein